MNPLLPDPSTASGSFLLSFAALMVDLGDHLLAVNEAGEPHDTNECLRCQIMVLIDQCAKHGETVPDLS